MPGRDALSMKCIGLVVISLDGCITRHNEEGAGFASVADQQFFRTVLQEFDSCVFGSRTFQASQPVILSHLTPQRLRIVMTRHPEQYAHFHQPELLEFTSAPPAEIIVDLQHRNKQRCAILGGGSVYTAFLENGLMDELWVTVEPRIFGMGKSLVTRLMDIQMSLKDAIRLSANTLLLKYAILREGK